MSVTTEGFRVMAVRTKALAEELSGGGYLEDPTAGIENMAEVRRRLLAEGIDTPLASNVAVTCFADIPRAVELDADLVVVDPALSDELRVTGRLEVGGVDEDPVQAFAENGYNALHWEQGGFSFWAVSDVRTEDLRALAALEMQRL